MAVPRFGKGDLVMAKWPGSTLYFEGAIEDLNDIEYLVKFEDADESQLAIKYKDVVERNHFRARSKSRGRSPGRPTKRASSKSPSRTKASSKSPARSKVANKSPKASSRSPGRRSAKVESKLEVSEISSKGSSSSMSAKVLNNSSSSSLISSSFFLNSRSSDGVRQTTPQRQSPRLASMERNDSKTITTTTLTTSGNRVGKAGAAGALKQVASTAVSCLSALWSVLLPATKGLVGIAMLVLTPLLLTQACTKKKCTIMEMPDVPLKLDSYYDIKAVLIVLAAFSLHVLLAYVPLRSRVLPNGAKARGNGIVTLLVSCLLVPLAMYLKYNVQLLYTLLRPLLASHVVLALLVALLLYAKSYYASRSQRNERTSGHFLPDLVEGREVSPRIGSLDVKTFLLRYCVCYCVVFNIVLILRDVQLSKGVYSPVLIMACGLQIFYMIDLVWFEDTFFTTWEYNKQGTGFLITATYLTFPFYFAVFTRTVLNHRPSLPWYCLVGISVVFLFGYVLIRASNNQKHAFRSNPSNPKLAHLESIPTSAGTRLLVSGWWGVIRHPNYVGDFIIQVTYAMLCGFSYGLPWLLVAFSGLSLLYRIYENEHSCSRKYGLSWTNYTGRVKYRLIPKVF